MHAVIETDAYLRAVKVTGMSTEEQFEATTRIATDPEGGAILQGTGGVRKARLAGRGKGKSGGYRIIWYFGGEDIPVFLLTVFGKGQKDNLSAAERKTLRSLVGTLRDSLRAS